MSPVIRKTQIGRPHFGNTKTSCDYELKNFTSKIRFDNNVAKYFKDL